VVRHPIKAFELSEWMYRWSPRASTLCPEDYG
jgi:hypothetical protein